MAIINEFRAFIARGSVIDMAVGIVMGAAFTAIVNSAVADIVMPLIGWALSGVDFSNYYLQLGGESAYASMKAAKEAGIPVIGYGALINAVINFLAVSWFVFWVVKLTNKVRVQKEAVDAIVPSEQEKLLTEIRDLLARK